MFCLALPFYRLDPGAVGVLHQHPGRHDNQLPGYGIAPDVAPSFRPTDGATGAHLHIQRQHIGTGVG